MRDEPIPMLTIIEITKWMVKTDKNGKKLFWIREIGEKLQTATEKVGQPIPLPILCAQQIKTADTNTDIVTENADNTANSNVGEYGTNEAGASTSTSTDMGINSNTVTKRKRENPDKSGDNGEGKRRSIANFDIAMIGMIVNEGKLNGTNVIGYITSLSKFNEKISVFNFDLADMTGVVKVQYYGQSKQKIMNNLRY